MRLSPPRGKVDDDAFAGWVKSVNKDGTVVFTGWPSSPPPTAAERSALNPTQFTVSRTDIDETTTYQWDQVGFLMVYVGGGF